MTINEALMERRRSRFRLSGLTGSKVASESTCVPDIRDRHADPEEQYLAKELVAKAFLGLHPSLSQLFTRHKARGWTQRELADKMGISVSAVKARIFSARERALAQLRLLC